MLSRTRDDVWKPNKLSEVIVNLECCPKKSANLFATSTQLIDGDDRYGSIEIA